MSKGTDYVVIPNFSRLRKLIGFLSFPRQSFCVEKLLSPFRLAKNNDLMVTPNEFLGLENDLQSCLMLKHLQI